MRQRDIILVLTLLGTIVLGMFSYTYLVKKTVPIEAPVVVPEQKTNSYGITRIDGKHFYRNGIHTIVGEIPMPTPCDLLTFTAAVAESMPEKVTFDFGVINNSDVCATVVTLQRFVVSATATPEAVLNARFNNMPVELNLVEAAPNETPESFELFIKG